jgi:hypothetical protein
MSKRIKIPKPRNPFVQHIVKRKGGAHGPTYKAQRKRAKDQLKQEVS